MTEKIDVTADNMAAESVENAANIASEACAPANPEGKGCKGHRGNPDFDIAQAKEAGDIDAELLARFRKFNRMLRGGHRPDFAKGAGYGPCGKPGRYPGSHGHEEPREADPQRLNDCHGFEGPVMRCMPGMPWMQGKCDGRGSAGFDPHNLNARHGFGPKGPFGPCAPMGTMAPMAFKGPKVPFGGPCGPKGPMGPMGPMGPKGFGCDPMGFQGPQGPQGPGACGFEGHPGFGGPNFGGRPGFGGPNFGARPGFDGPAMNGRDGFMGRGRVLTALSLQDGLTQKDLAFILGIRPQSLGELLGKLEADGYVTRERSEADRRAITVKLTDAGREKAAKIQEKRNAVAGNLFDKLTDEEKATLAALLAKLQD